MIEVSVEPRDLSAGDERELEIRFSNFGRGTCTDIVFRVDLPPQILLLRGRSRVEIPELNAGDTRAHKLTVCPREVGEFAVTSTNFSYRNEYGTPVPVPGFRVGLTVRPGSPPTEPDLGITVSSGPLAHGEWGELRLRVRNHSPSALRGLLLAVGGPVRLAPPGTPARLPDLAAGQEAEASFIVCPVETGQHVPVQVRASYAAGSGLAWTQVQPVALAVSSPSPAGPGLAAERVQAPNRILFLAASPKDLPPLRLGEEMREIEEQLQLGRYRDRFRFESAQAVRLKDIGYELANRKPWIVHFAGHGKRDGSLYVEDEKGYSTPAGPVGLAELFRLRADTIECVVVNACHSLRLGQAVADTVTHVIAMRNEIADPAAITFSTGFYQSLAAGEPIAKAFVQGRALFLAQTGGKPGDDGTPLLLGPGGRELV
jgi:hypothetical protein